MKTISYKGLTDNPVLDVDDKSRRVKNALNKVGVLDSDKDIVDKSAFDKTIVERGPSGKNLIWHLTDHNPSLKYAVGKFSELYMEGDYLVGVTVIPETTWGNDVLKLYQAGLINQHSIGFSTMSRQIMEEDNDEKRYTIIKEVKLFEASTVLWGANEETPNLSVGKSLTKEEKGLALLKQIEAMDEVLRKGTVSDDTFSLLEIRVKQLHKELSELISTITTQPEVKSVEPVQEDYTDLIQVIKSFTNKIK